MNLQELLGEAYKENMTLADVENALQGKNLVDLSTGGYVDINKHNREVESLKTQIQNKNKEIQDSNSKASNEKTENQSTIAQLQEELKQLNIENNRSNAIAGLAEAKNLLGIKDDDTEYTGFISDISELNRNNANNIIQYLSKQVKGAYEKGKQDAIKNAMGNMGKVATTSGNTAAKSNGDFGKELANKVYQGNSNFDYFNKNK